MTGKTCQRGSCTFQEIYKNTHSIIDKSPSSVAMTVSVHYVGAVATNANSNAVPNLRKIKSTTQVEGSR